jgi:acyl dehydratase
VSPAGAAGGPWFDELSVGQVFDGAPPVTLTGGLAAAHQAFTGDRLALALDDTLAGAVLGTGRIAHPALVWDLVIGQSTEVTQRVKANLFYRGLAFARAPVIGDTLATRTEVVALRQNRPRPGRAPTGLAALHVTTTDQLGRPVLDFYRCAMLPLSDRAPATGHDDDVTAVGPADIGSAAAGLTGGWKMAPLARPGAPVPGPGQVVRVAAGDVVSGAPELARLTLNVAAVHYDELAAGGHRLVYGGHTIGLALSQACRAFPALATVAGWHSCEHPNPVREDDTLHSVIEVTGAGPLPGGGHLVHLRSLVTAGPGGRRVLDWHFAAVFG